MEPFLAHFLLILSRCLQNNPARGRGWLVAPRRAARRSCWKAAGVDGQHGQGPCGITTARPDTRWDPPSSHQQTRAQRRGGTAMATWPEALHGGIWEPLLLATGPKVN